ncbi:uncharacterized protein LOC120426321 [Culex pipiens pallens]|uniref:uncharacterized protein LOC120426321 n=1 Tax=Culex pipiens pallens TaxID=42434 RepID=UPI001954B0B6|nr:uncharacterized protein LOC120426321 [Culex pipiens pallens]
MRDIGLVFQLLLGIALCSAYNLDTLNIVLKSIEYLISVKPGAFSCVFYDVAPHYPHDNILDAILKSPRLDHVAKYVVNGSERTNVYKLPWNPSLLLLHTGNNVSHLESFDVIVDMFYFMYLFDPATKMLVFVDELYTPAMIQMQGHVYYASFNYFVYIGDTSKDVYQCNGVYCWNRPREQHPMYLFSYCRRSMQGRNITYIKDERVLSFAWNSKWLNETARYLNTTTAEYPHNCEASDEAYQQCYQNHSAGNGADILLIYMTFDRPDATIPRNFRQVFTTHMVFSKIAVPRDRPVNTAELLAMPFSWQVWTLLVTILVLSEIAKRLFPTLIENDPVLLVVCGYEKHDLHRAGRPEKIILLSLIILMFFMSNAFETKIVSLMVSKPSIQRVQTLDDLYQSGIKLYEDLEHNPQFVVDSVLKRFVAQGTRTEFHETRPDAAVYWNSDYVDVFKDVAFDYERMQPFYVVLDFEHFSGFELYWVSPRNQLVKELRFIHITLTETGFMGLWKQQWRDEIRSKYIGRRPRVDINEKADLNFDDMQPAWLALGVGLCVSLVGFVGEHLAKRFNARVLKLER